MGKGVERRVSCGKEVEVVLALEALLWGKVWKGPWKGSERGVRR